MKKPKLSDQVKHWNTVALELQKQVDDAQNVIRSINTDRQNAINEINYLRRMTERLSEALIKGSEAIISNHKSYD
jgi:DNA-directed RNA polymerase alpha subunit